MDVYFVLYVLLSVYVLFVMLLTAQGKFLLREAIKFKLTN